MVLLALIYVISSEWLRKLFPGILVGSMLVFVQLPANAQTFDTPGSLEEFATAAKSNIHKIATEEALNLGEDFEGLWSGIGADHQNKMIRQTGLMADKGYKIKPFFLAYFKSIVLAIKVENIAEDQLLSMLNVTGKVIELHPPEDLLNYLTTINNFFEKRALYQSSANQLLISNAEYDFEYHDVAGLSQDLFSEIDESGFEEEYVEEEYDEYDDEEFADDEYEDDPYYDDYDDDEEGYDDDEYYDDYDDEIIDDAYEEYDDDVLEYFPDPPPPLEGPVIRFHAADILVKGSRTAVAITHSKGAYIINSKLFAADGGELNWPYSTQLKDSAKVKFQTFNIDATKPEVTARAVELQADNTFSEIVPGEFTFDGRRGPSGTKFISYTNGFRYKKVEDQGLTLTGGVTIVGGQMKTSSKLFGISSLTATENGIKRFTADGYGFEIKDSLISAPGNVVKVFHNFDSIYHPAATIRFNTNSNELVVRSDHDNYRYAPFFSSFTNTDITADMLKWDIDSDSLEISIIRGKSELPVIFQSVEYFDSEVLASLAKNYTFNPLMIAVEYDRRTRKRKFFASDVATYFKQNEGEVDNALQELAYWGYINYDRSNGMYSLKKKARHYYLAQRDRTDFDNLIILSKPASGPNVIFDMKNEEMHINGIERFFISEILDVYITPDSNRVTLGNNRNFNFNGTLSAGNFDYIGQEFNFDYDSFLVRLNKIDKIQFYLQDENSRGSRRSKVDNVISGLSEEDSLSTGSGLDEFEGTSGVLYINKPDNKSGRKVFATYPKFEGGGAGSVVFFNGPEYLDGTYGKHLYFILPPFNLDSLSDSDPAAINFTGTFNSRGMFPAFKEKLHIMPDNSLGFDHSIPPDGYQLYEGDATLFNRVSLDKRGLVGTGTIEYLTASFDSDGYVFYPDSMVSRGTLFSMAEEQFKDVVFPQISVEDYNLKWLPSVDSMYVSNNSSLINLYNGLASLDGTSTITHGGVYGKGNLLSLGTETISNQFNFQYDRILARHAVFNVNPQGLEKPALAGNDIRLNFDLLQNKAEINPEIEGSAALEFPYAQFKTSIPTAVWDLAESKVTMNKPDNVDIKYSYFYTTREDLDSLSFNATQAVYDMNTNDLVVSGIPFIKVADSKITPEGGEVLILENSRIGTLKNTTIVIDTLYGYHQLYDGTIDIISRNEFSGSGTYQFVNAARDTFAIKMENFRLEERLDEKKKKSLGLQTVANGLVVQDDQVIISPGIFYKGNITMKAQKRALELDGYVKLNLEKIDGYNTWIQYASDAEQQEVILNFDEALTETAENLVAGLHFDYQNYSLYSTFITDKRDAFDEDFYSPAGLLRFVQANNEYTIVEQDRDLGLKFEGKFYSYNEETSDITFEGPVNFIKNSKDRSIDASVIGKGNLNSSEFKINALLSMDFNIPTAIYDMIASDLVLAIDEFGAPEALEQNRVNLVYKLANTVGDKPAKSYQEQSFSEYTPLASISPLLVKPFVFSNINFAWSEEQKAFYNEGGKLGLSHMLKTDLNANFEGFFEIRRGVEGDRIDMFFKASPESWYYFSIEDNKLLIFSSNELLNEFVAAKTNQGKAKIGEMVFAPGDIGETRSFINTFRKVYYGIDEPYDLGGELKKAEDKKKATDDEGF